MPKQTKKPQSKFSKLRSYTKAHKLAAVISVILLLLVGNFLYNKYLDWDNAQMIKGLSRDFPALIEQIERETGLELEIESNCMQTQEKFSGGVSTCEYSVLRSEVSDKDLHKQNTIFEKQKLFSKGEEFANKEGYSYKYRNKNSCTFRYIERIYISCIVGVRDANKGNIQQLLNH